MAINNSLLIHQYKRKDYEYNVTDYLKKDGTYDRAALLRDARKIAKANNQRLLRLEQAGLTSSPAYQGAVKALSGVYDKTGSVPYGHVSKAGKPRYKERVDKLSNEELRRMLYAASKTSQAKTSTTGGVKKIYSKGLENLNKLAAELGISNMTENDIMKIFRDKAFKELIKTYGYQAVLQTVSDSYNELDLQEDVKDNDYKFVQLSQMVSDYIEKYEKAPDNVLELRKLLGLDIPKEYKDDAWIPSV